jgi:hypothetical protein
MTLITEIYGVKGHKGMLMLEPKLSSNYFDSDNKSHISTIFSTYKISVTYHNPDGLSYDNYCIKELKINDVNLDVDETTNKSLIIENFNHFSKYHVNDIYVKLG